MEYPAPDPPPPPPPGWDVNVDLFEWGGRRGHIVSLAIAIASVILIAFGIGQGWH